MIKPKASSIQAGPETDTFIHVRVFHRTDDPAPPYTTDQRVAEWLADEYELGTMPIVAGINDETPVGYMATRKTEPHEGFQGHEIDFEVLTDGETFPLAIARAVLVVAGIVEQDKVMRKA